MVYIHLHYSLALKIMSDHWTKSWCHLLDLVIIWIKALWFIDSNSKHWKKCKVQSLNSSHYYTSQFKIKKQAPRGEWTWPVNGRKSTEKDKNLSLLTAHPCELFSQPGELTNQEFDLFPIFPYKFWPTCDLVNI